MTALGIESTIDAVAIFGSNSTSIHLVRLFATAGIRVFSIENDENKVSHEKIVAPVSRYDFPFVSSVLINLQDEATRVVDLLEQLPMEFNERMAFVEGSVFMKENQRKTVLRSLKSRHYLSMSLVESETSSATQPDFHLIFSGDEIVFDKVFLRTKIPSKLIFLRQSRSPFDSFYLCLFHRFSQMIHSVIYGETLSIVKTCTGSGNFVNLLNWSFVRRPVMRQIVLRSSSSSFNLTTINELESLLESVLELFFDERSQRTFLGNLAFQIHRFVSALDSKLKEKSIVELFELF